MTRNDQEKFEREAPVFSAFFRVGDVEDARPTPGFAIPPYHVETFPIGSAVMNANGFNCLAFHGKPGAKFTTKEHAEAICNAWNANA